jgi:uncharacterized protein YecT (DUF1311 family)
MRRTLFLFALATASAPALALDCKNAMSTPEINECAAAEQKAVEAKLNEVYRRVIKSLDTNKDSAAAKDKLVLAQRAWVKFREADCEAVYENWAGGTIRTVMYIGCMQQHAEHRIKDLEGFVGGH